jgi:rSAM/selenodomain-associated transferase 2
MHLSVIIPALNEGSQIRRTLRSLEPFRARGAEVIVIDGGSVDDTLAIATSFADSVLRTARGRALQMNAGAGAARGEILLFLHADCIPPPEADMLVLQQLGPKGWGRFDVSLAGTYPMFRMIERLMNLRSRLTGIATGDQGIFVRRELFFAVGGYPNIPLMEDLALSKRLKRTGRPLCLQDRIITSSRRWEEQGIIRTVLLMWRLRLAYFFGAEPGRLAKIYDRRKG